MESSLSPPVYDDFISARVESTVEYEEFDGTNQIRAHLSITVIACFISFIGNTLVMFCIWRTPLLHDVTWLYQGVVCFSVLLHTVALPFSYMSHTDPMNWPLEGVYSCQAVHFFSDFGNVFMRLSMLTACALRWLSYTSLNSISKRRPVLTVLSFVAITLVISIISSIPSVQFVFLYEDAEYGLHFCLFNDVRSPKYKMWFTYLLIMTLVVPLLVMMLTTTLLMVRGDRLYAEEYDPRMEFHDIHQSQQQRQQHQRHQRQDEQQHTTEEPPVVEPDFRRKAFDPTMLSSTVLKNPVYDEKTSNDKLEIEKPHKQESDPTIVKDNTYVIELEDFRTLTIRDQKKATLMQLAMTVSFAVCLAPISIVWGIYVSSDFNNSSPALFHCYRIAGLVATTFPIHIPVGCFLFSRHLRENVMELCKIRGLFMKITRALS